MDTCSTGIVSLSPSGDTYLQKVATSRQKIAQVANPFIRDGTVQQLMYMYTYLPIRLCTIVHVHVLPNESISLYTIVGILLACTEYM